MRKTCFLGEVFYMKNQILICSLLFFGATSFATTNCEIQLYKNQQFLGKEISYVYDGSSSASGSDGFFTFFKNEESREDIGYQMIQSGKQVEIEFFNVKKVVGAPAQVETICKMNAQEEDLSVSCDSNGIEMQVLCEYIPEPLLDNDWRRLVENRLANEKMRRCGINLTVEVVAKKESFVDETKSWIVREATRRGAILTDSSTSRDFDMSFKVIKKSFKRCDIEVVTQDPLDNSSETITKKSLKKCHSELSDLLSEISC